MYAVITNGFNLVCRWMGVWLACNLVTGALIRLDGWQKRRRTRKAMKMLPEGRRRVTAVVRETETQIIMQGADAPEADKEQDAEREQKSDEKSDTSEEQAAEEKPTPAVEVPAET